MKAIDTNLIIRLLVQDDLEQAEAAKRVVSEGVFVPVTVLLETGWVLTRYYRQQRHTIADALVALLDAQTIHVTDEPGLRLAIDLFRAGADLADAIHLVAAGSSDAFVTFDRDLARLREAPIRIELAG